MKRSLLEVWISRWLGPAMFATAALTSASVPASQVSTSEKLLAKLNPASLSQGPLATLASLGSGASSEISQVSESRPGPPGPQQSSVAMQQEAMRKLQFLAGHWSGAVTISRGPGEPLHLTQTEEIAYKLDGLVLLIQGKSTDSDGRPQFEALATIAYDDATHVYRIRAYNDGRYVDTAIEVKADGFNWGFANGPVHIANSMQLTAKGEWHETTEVKFAGNPPRQSVEMLLKKQ